MAKQMTEGRPLFLIFSFALPLLAGNILQQTYNMADAAIVGRVLGADALAAVGATSSVQFLVMGFCIGICCGFGIPLATYFGAGDIAKVRTYIYNSAFLTLLAAVLITAVCAAACPQILTLLSTPENIYDDAYIYLLIIFLGIPFTLFYNLLSAALRAVGDSRTPFIFLAASAILNIALDLICIITLKLGCAGAAIATVAAQAISGILCLIFILKKYPQLFPAAENRTLSKRALSNLLAAGVPMGLQYSITAIGSMVMQSANNGLGSVYVSGFTAGMKIKQFMLCPFDAVATAVSVYCSQNLGAGKTERISKGIISGMLAAAGYGVLAGLVLIIFGRTLSGLFVDNSSPAVLDAAEKYLYCLGFFFFTLGILSVCRMTTQGLGFSGRAVISGVAEMAARIIVSLVFVPIYGYTAICFADQAAWVSACLYIAPMCFICVRKAIKRHGG